MSTYLLTLLLISCSAYFGYQNGRKRGHMEGHKCEFIATAIYDSMTAEEKDRPL